LLAPHPILKLEDHPLLFVTTPAYSIYSQLSTIAGGRSSIPNGLSDHDAQLLTTKYINPQTVSPCSYSIRNINKYSGEEFKNRLSYEFGTSYLVIMTTWF
jgi:hypothetical protein